MRNITAELKRNINKQLTKFEEISRLKAPPPQLHSAYNSLSMLTGEIGYHQEQCTFNNNKIPL